MNLRTRLLVTSLFVVLLPLALLGWALYRDMSGRLTVQYEERVDELAARMENELLTRIRTTYSRLEALAGELRADTRFRLAAFDEVADERNYLLDYAEGALALTGLDMLQVQDEEGRIISSGHYRNEFDRMEPALPQLLAQSPYHRSALTWARVPGDRFLVLAGSITTDLSGHSIDLVGGFALNEELLTRMASKSSGEIVLLAGEKTLSSASRGPGATSEESNDFRRDWTIPLVVDNGKSAYHLVDAMLIVTHPRAPLEQLLSHLRLRLSLLLGAAALGSIFLSAWLAARVSKPIRTLAARASDVDLDRLDVRFPMNRSDEVGTLSRLLGEMTSRLRGSAARLRETERLATLGEIARQINHDLRNGLTPIKNVIRHLSQLSRTEPSELPRVFSDRVGTIESSLDYLETLSTNYSRIATPPGKTICDLGEIIRQAVPSAADLPVRIDCKLAVSPLLVLADPVGLRRILDNLLRNARESFGPEGGTITVTTRLVSQIGSQPVIELEVSDDGCGIEPANADMIFEHFYSSKKNGSGLGLSIVKRLVTDFEGSIKMRSEPGRGTRFLIRFPAAATGTDSRGGSC